MIRYVCKETLATCASVCSTEQRCWRRLGSISGSNIKCSVIDGAVSSKCSVIDGVVPSKSREFLYIHAANMQSSAICMN